MGIRRLTFTAFDTTQTDLKDSLVHINSDASGENTADMGFLLNRGTLGNVGIIWDESADTFAFISTTSNALVDGDMAITNYAELVSGNITGDNLITAGVVDATGNITGGNLTTGGAVDATGNITGDNLITAGVVDATGNITGGNITTAGIGTFGTMTDGTVSFTSGNISGVDELRIDQSGTGLRMTNVGAFDNDGSDNFRIFSTNDLKIAANGENGTAITVDATNQDVTITNDLRVDAGNLYIGGTAVTATATELNYVDGVTSAIQTQLDAKGTLSNIVEDTTPQLGGDLDGQAFNITTTGNISATEFQGVATSAQYADLAEKYLPDQVYAPGLVLIIGGDAEVTASSEYADPRIAGVVSTDPAFKMNSALENGVYIALRGRVPCFVVGEIAKGDLLTSSHVPGIATRLNPGDFLPGCVIGKALENYNSNDIGTIEVLIGSL